MNNPKKIPVRVARSIAKGFSHSQIIILGWSRKNNMTSVVTYGETIIDCDQASQGGNWIKKNLLNWAESECMIEPKRVLRLKAEIKDLKKKLKIHQDIIKDQNMAISQ
jgi:hypothetical protein